MTTGTAINKTEPQPHAGLAAWLLSRLRGTRRQQPSLALLERITLAPRQSLSLIQADGRRFLVATSADGTPAFFSLEGPNPRSRARERSASSAVTRVSW